jgi:hypothetical protein
MFKKILKVVIILLTFWLLDLIFHEIGVGESNYYFLSKFGNGLLFAIMWVFIFYQSQFWKKIIYSLIFGTWVSFYYLATSYSGLVQFLGISARYTPPPFVIFGMYFSPYLWWVFHGLVFYVGLELSELLIKKNYE